MLEKITEYASSQFQRWCQVYDYDQHTDSGKSLKAHADACISAYTELLSFLRELEKDLEERL